MGKIKKKNYNFNSCFIVGVIAGILLGGVIMTTIISYKMDTLYENIAQLEYVINEKDAKLEKLEESINTMNFVLEDIQVIVDFKSKDIEDKIDKIEIEKVIKEKYTNLLGKEVNTIDPDLVIEVVDQRIFRLEGKEYKLLVNKLVLTETLKLWIEVGLVDEKFTE
ncbi:hypothetical protein K8M07_07160 [Schnuerera sp. xch1]|uniref:hypothetical protein n=1 Tax=Schnuerera sp. xch1 TaxID=2874283 RepID=UPI001CBB653F|nr:hypothetical protein [Schnuerera sp. xch1]MBZ2175030.1 hypothetical protein [Schnuerera sp. xch1]